MNEIKQAIADYLDAAADGSFATSGSLPDAVNPGLLLKGIGKIGLPLSERDAKSIINISREAPSCESTEENIDKSERKTYGVEADRVEFRNPRWSKTVQYAVSKSVEQLGVLGGESSVRADLHKLVLYEAGGLPSTEHDSYAVSGRVGTLVIILPSEHEGGEAVVRLENQKRTLSINEAREFSYSYMAWYADADYSVEPVSSGYRLVLMYNLIHQTGDIKAARPLSVLNDNRDAIDSALNAWKTRLCDGETATDVLVHLFECEYLQGKLGLQALEGSDQVQSLRLHEACQEYGFSTFLGQLKHTVRQTGYEEEDEEDQDQDWTLVKLFTLEGVCIAENLDVEQGSVVQIEPFGNESPDDEQCDDWYEEGAAITKTYQRSCVVIVPSDHLDAFLRKASRLNISDWMQALLDTIEDEGSVEGVKDEAFKICSLSTGK
ncbi:hypothetical protein IMSHALPRED_006643 [Imshaugia aleurites]|uniref:Uncharacterized protein n=1 Tax=Imshaugia aleurites TaxID=172621 RepID=A0A8H3ELY8_9LECA|nr:hypothetical protein IMSHALPRED_006643 [Imshaugia aleurites]